MRDNCDRTTTKTRRTNDQTLPNNTLNGYIEQTCTDKLSNIALEKNSPTSVKQCWRKTDQCIKTTRDMDITKMTN